MKFKGFNSEDFEVLAKLKEFNNKNYKRMLINKRRNEYRSQYKSVKLEKEAKEMNREVYKKIIALKDYLVEDPRFKNFKIDVCTPLSQPGRGKLGKYRANLWISMVDQKEYEKLKKKTKGISPKLKLPQVQIGISPDGFETAELWFEKTAWNHLEKFINHFKDNFPINDNLDLFCWEEYNESSRFYREATKANFELFKEKINNEKINEASISFWKKENDVTDNVNLVEIIKNDLLILIKQYYEPVFGKILRKFSNPAKGKHKNDIEKKKKIENIGYDVVAAHFESIGFEVIPVYKDNVGWDLEAIDEKEKLLLEVKGLSGEEVNIELTPNEYCKMKKYKKEYRVCVVANALIKPDLYIFSNRQKGKWIDQHGNVMKEKKKVALKMFL